jgi:alpha-N-arabinofuranosidase
MLWTPTYHVFDMYKVHKESTFIPFEIKTDNVEIGDKSVPAISATCSKSAEGSIHLSLVNIDPKNSKTISCKIDGAKLKSALATILTSENVRDHNTFDQPNKVKLEDFKKFSLKGDLLTIDVPAKSIVTIDIK